LCLIVIVSTWLSIVIPRKNYILPLHVTLKKIGPLKRLSATFDITLECWYGVVIGFMTPESTHISAMYDSDIFDAYLRCSARVKIYQI